VTSSLLDKRPARHAKPEQGSCDAARSRRSHPERRIARATARGLHADW